MIHTDNTKNYDVLYELQEQTYDNKHTHSLSTKKELPDYSESSEKSKYMVLSTINFRLLDDRCNST